jgi:AAA family ATP:ADP antiporter
MTHLNTEAISAIKIWLVLPISLVFMFFYIKLSDRLTRSQLFHTMNWFFISFFVLFTLVIYPNYDALSINISEDLIIKLPVFKYLFAIIKNWHHSLFYVFSDCWVTIMLSISFWQIANHITSYEESKRFYSLFGFAAQIGLFLASLFAKLLTLRSSTIWQSTLNSMTVAMVIAGISLSLCLIALKKVIGGHVFNLRASCFKTKNKISMKESLKYIASSKPILLITSLILCYNVSISLVEGVWKKSTEVFFNKDLNQIIHFMSNVNIYASVLSLICAAIGVYLLQVCKWGTLALITPITTLITGSLFFILMILGDTSYALVLQTSALSIAIYFGAINNMCARAAKHTIFDTTKEMVYIPLDDNLKTKGKAAAEAIGMGFGKGAGAFIEQVLLVCIPSLSLLNISPIYSVIFLIVLAWWLYSTVSLSKWLSQTGV